MNFAVQVATGVACGLMVAGWAAHGAAFESEGFTEPYRTINVAADETGIVEEVFVREGQTVEADQPLSRLNSDVHEAMLAIAEHEEFAMTKRDITHNINFFMNVPVTAEGGLTFEDGISAPGKYVEMKAAMDVIVLISNCPQLNNPCNAYKDYHCYEQIF